jgi:hypothetical protein
MAETQRMGWWPDAFVESWDVKYIKTGEPLTRISMRNIGAAGNGTARWPGLGLRFSRARPFAENTAKKQRISPYRVVPQKADR